jgi:hypothetical protein
MRDASVTILLYRDTCARCRLLSRLAVSASLGALVRVPLASPLGARILQDVPATRGNLVLMRDRRMVIGWRVIPGVLSSFWRRPRSRDARA